MEQGHPQVNADLYFSFTGHQNDLMYVYTHKPMDTSLFIIPLGLCWVGVGDFQLQLGLALAQWKCFPPARVVKGGNKKPLFCLSVENLRVGFKAQEDEEGTADFCLFPSTSCPGHKKQEGLCLPQIPAVCLFSLTLRFSQSMSEDFHQNHLTRRMFLPTAVCFKVH